MKRKILISIICSLILVSNFTNTYAAVASQEYIMTQKIRLIVKPIINLLIVVMTVILCRIVWKNMWECKAKPKSWCVAIIMQLCIGGLQYLICDMNFYDMNKYLIFINIVIISALIVLILVIYCMSKFKKIQKILYCVDIGIITFFIIQESFMMLKFILLV